MRIIGVDFSGAGSHDHVGKTWIAQGRLEGNTLTIESCHPISRVALTNELAGLSKPAVVAMDFPFSVPEEFAEFWQCDIASRCDTVVFDTMPDLWAAAANLKWSKFKDDLQVKLRLVEFNGKPKRPCDPLESKSPLHTVHPNMVPMTFRGMAMLHDLWRRLPQAIWVPPMPEPTGYNITLLEVMPGATVRRLAGEGFHNRYKNGQGWVDTRLKILSKLLAQSGKWGLRLSGVNERTELCLANDDAMDAIIAAITAALWKIRVPPVSDSANCPRASLVGWMYVPRRANE